MTYFRGITGIPRPYHNRWLQREPTGGWLKELQSSLPYLDISPLDGEIHVFPTLGEFLWYLTRINWPIVLSFKCILHCYGVSDKVSCSRNPKEYSIPYRNSPDHTNGSTGCPTSQNIAYLSKMPQTSNSQILSNILYPIEYSYGYTEVPAGYPTFSIAYLIYSTPQWALITLLERVAYQPQRRQRGSSSKSSESSSRRRNKCS